MPMTLFLEYGIGAFLNFKKKHLILIGTLIVVIVGVSVGVLYFTRNITEKTIKDTKLTITSLEVKSADDESMNVTVNGTIDNPSEYSGTLKNASLTLEYNNVTFGATSISQLEVKAGETKFSEDLTISITNSSQYFEFIKDFVEKDSVTFSIRISGTIESDILTFEANFIKTVSLTGMNGNLNFTLNRFDILNATEDSFFANVSLTVNNPSTVSMNLPEATFEFYTNDTLVGNLTMHDLNIKPGENNFTRIVLVKIANIDLFNSITKDLLSNKDVNLVFKGAPSGKNILSRVFEHLSIPFTMKGIPPVKCIILSIELINSSSNSVTFSTDLQIYAPIPGSVQLNDLKFNVTYKNEELGQIEFGDITVKSGTHVYSVVSKLIITDTAILSELLTDYLNGSTIVLRVKGMAQSGNIIADVVNNYEQDIILPSAPEFHYAMENLELVNTTKNTLTMNSTLIITNPTPLNVSLDKAILNVSYSGSWIGNITVEDPVKLTPGNNTINVQITISGEENKSAVEDFLSKHLEGNDVSLYLYGTLSLRLEGMIEPLNVSVTRMETFKGLSEDIVKGVKLNFINLTFYYDYDIGKLVYEMQANVNVTIYNPFDFDINITYVYYELYYDDDDGCDYNFIVITVHYDPINHKYLDTIEHDYSSAPVLVQTKSNKTLNEVISSNDEETCARLYDEYYNDNDLYIDAENGIVKIQIGQFIATLHFEFHDIYVPSS